MLKIFPPISLQEASADHIHSSTSAVERNGWKEAFPNYWTLKCKVTSVRMFSLRKIRQQILPQILHDAEYTDPKLLFCWKSSISSIEDLLRNSIKKSLAVLTLLLATLAVRVLINPIPGLFWTIKLYRNFLGRIYNVYFWKRDFSHYLYRVIFYRLWHLRQKAPSAEFPQCRFHFFHLCVPGVLRMSEAIWWLLRHINFRSSEPGA